MFLSFLVTLIICILTIEHAKYAIGCRNKDGIVALILARGGSKGLINKNLVHIDGISLLGRSITKIQRSKCFQDIWVSTDNKEIATEAIRYGAIVHIRPEEYATDESSSLDSIKEFLDKNRTINRFALFQCTSVFLNEMYIEEAFTMFQESDCVFAVKRSHSLRWKLINGFLHPTNFDPIARPRRQDWSGEFIETGMFYFSSRKLVDNNKLQNERCSYVEINSEDSLEIDTPMDLNVARCVIKKKLREECSFYDLHK